MSTPTNIQAVKLDARDGEGLATSLSEVILEITDKVFPSLSDEDVSKFYIALMSRLIGQAAADFGPDEVLAMLDALKQALSEQAPSFRAQIARETGGLN